MPPWKRPSLVGAGLPTRIGIPRVIWRPPPRGSVKVALQSSWTSKQKDCISFSARLHSLNNSHVVRPSALASMFIAPRFTPAMLRRRKRLPVWCYCTALVLGSGAWPSRADATCGDYVTFGSGHFAMPDARTTEQLPRATRAGIPLPGGPARLPFDCPGCSSRQAPVTLPVVVHTQHDLTWACVGQEGGILESPPCRATPAQESLTVQGPSFRILRPPRALSRVGSARDKVA
jgi:hypothetical protein